MANTRQFSTSKKTTRKLKKVYSQERIDHAAYAFDHLSDMVIILRYHTEEQKSAVETGTPPSSKDSQTLMKTLLSAFKQMDHYLEIIAPPMLIDEAREEEQQDSETKADADALLFEEDAMSDFVEEQNAGKAPLGHTISSRLPYEEFSIQAGYEDYEDDSFIENSSLAYRHNGRYKRH